MFIGAGGDEICAPEWCSFKSMAPPDNVTREDLIGAFNIAPDSFHIKYNLIKIPHLLCKRLDVL